MAKQTNLNLGEILIMNPIQIADEITYNAAMDIIDANPHVRKADDFAAFNQNAPANYVMEPIHSATRPIMIDNRHIALLWQDEERPGNPDYMAGIILEIIPRGDKTFRKVPCGIIIGDQFQGVMQYRCPCCGDNSTGFSMMFFVMNAHGDIEYATRDSLATEKGKRKMFENVADGVTVSSAQIQHILHHHNNAGHNCGHNHNHLPRNIEAQKPRLK